jgi:H/ACA ribonucleoprotein complex subunit 3
MPLLQCAACKAYTLAAECPRCGGKPIKPGPAKYSPEDHYGRYRRLAKRGARAPSDGKQA